MRYFKWYYYRCQQAVKEYIDGAPQEISVIASTDLSLLKVSKIIKALRTGLVRMRALTGIKVLGVPRGRESCFRHAFVVVTRLQPGFVYR